MRRSWGIWKSVTLSDVRLVRSNLVKFKGDIVCTGAFSHLVAHIGTAIAYQIWCVSCNSVSLRAAYA